MVVQMARSRILNPAMQVNNISPHSIGGSRNAGGGSKGRDTPLSAGGAVQRRVYDPVSGAPKVGPGTSGAANWRFDRTGDLYGTQGDDREGFSGPNSATGNLEENPAKIGKSSEGRSTSRRR